MKNKQKNTIKIKRNRLSKNKTKKVRKQIGKGGKYERNSENNKNVHEMCRLFDTLNWNTSDYMNKLPSITLDEGKNITELYIKNSNTFSNYTYRIGNNKLKINTNLSYGAYGKVLDGEYNGKRVVLKIPFADDDLSYKTIMDMFMYECKIQSAINCKLLNDVPISDDMAGVPQIELIGKYNYVERYLKKYSMLNYKRYIPKKKAKFDKKREISEERYLIGMEYIDKNASEIFKECLKKYSDSPVKCSKMFINMLICVSNTLQVLQSKAKFMHRDLHLENIMYNSVTNKWYIIDFGLSKLYETDRENADIDMGVKMGVYSVHEYNSTHDKITTSVRKTKGYHENENKNEN